MRSPEEMKIIEIDITNACIHKCSNCTRMCGHHKKPYFMTWETFKRAVDSLEGFEGGVGMMGGEPTLHPEFERFANYLNSKYEDEKEYNYFIQPTSHFMRDRKLEERNLTYTYREKNGIGQRIKGPVLFSSLASNYHKYYEVIQDVFRYQGINDHSVACYHQPMLVSRKDLNIKDNEWFELRDRCWVQNTWSASITPKGCFFCEIAGALDMLFDGPGGWPIEKGWWKRKPEDFKDQLHWCELCGAALNTKSRDANEGIDDVSPTLYKMLEKIDSPKLKRQQYIHLYTENDAKKVENGDNRKFQYHDNNMNRLAQNNKMIYPDAFQGIIIANQYDTAEDIINCASYNREQFDKLIVFVGNEILFEVEERLKEKNIKVCQLEAFWGENINRANEYFEQMTYNVLFTSGVRFDKEFSSVMSQYAINPGTFHYLSSQLSTKCRLIRFENTGNKDWVVLFNTAANSLKKVGYDGVKFCKDFDEFRSCWNEKKQVVFDDNMLCGRKLVNSLEYEKECRYVVFGTGTYGEKAYQSIQKLNSEVVFFCDTNEEKQGKKLHGIDILSPGELRNRRRNFDKVVIAALAYNDIRKEIINNGLSDLDIIAPIF